MRRFAWGTMGLIAAAAWCGAETTYVAGSQAVAPSASSLITHVIASEGRPHAVVVVDPQNRTLAVYHIDSSTGKLTLKSVRNATWDLQMQHFNTEEPLPQDIRSAHLAQ